MYVITHRKQEVRQNEERNTKRKDGNFVLIK